jgi:predicted acylesterase/phospholipase RssA
VQHQVRKFLQPLLGNATIGDCTTPFVCLAGKVKHPIKWSKVLKPNFTEYFLSSFQHHVFPPETNIIDAVTASSAVPVIFNPYKIEAQEFIDVIYFGAIPIEFLQEAYKPDVIIATDTNPYYNNIYKRLPQHVHTFIKDGYQSIEQSKKLANLCLWPKSIAGIHRFDKTKDFMETGHQEATKNLAEILQLVGK